MPAALPVKLQQAKPVGIKGFYLINPSFFNNLILALIPPGPEYFPKSPFDLITL